MKIVVKFADTKPELGRIFQIRKFTSFENPIAF